MRVPVGERWNDDGTGAVDYFIAVKFIRGNQIAINR
jgi:hypothetical protein